MVTNACVPLSISITGVLGVWGGYADYVRVHARQVVGVPDALIRRRWPRWSTAGRLRRTAFASRWRANPAVSSSWGAGPIGFLCAELLRAAGVPVQVIQLGSRLRREALARLGHDVVASFEEALQPADVVIDCAGTPAVRRARCERARTAWPVPPAGYARVPEMDFAAVARKEVRIQGIRSGRRQDLVSIIDGAASREIRLPEITRWPLSAANDAVAALRDRQVGGKAVLIPDAVWSAGRL